MFLVNETLSIDGERLATICMRDDGLFEGRLYRRVRSQLGGTDQAMRFDENYELCGVADTLTRIQAVVYEELNATKTTD